MQISTLLFSLAALASTTIALPTASAPAYTIYGSPGTVTLKGFTNELGAATCNTLAPTPPSGTATIRLPAAYMNTPGIQHCGKTVTIYYTPRENGGLAEAPQLTSMQATMYGTCPSCESWQVEGSPEVFDKVWPGLDSAEGTWGPSVVFN